jgi:Zn-finger protein
MCKVCCDRPLTPLFGESGVVIRYIFLFVVFNGRDVFDVHTQVLPFSSGRTFFILEGNMDYYTNWQGKGYSFIKNTACEYFPCHKSENENEFNCIFCFCPLFAYENCGGSFSYTVDKHKDCSACTIPHSKESYGVITERLRCVKIT